jgi:hypothetical protein
MENKVFYRLSFIDAIKKYWQRSLFTLSDFTALFWLVHQSHIRLLSFRHNLAGM